MLRSFGVANDAQDHGSGAEAEQIRRDSRASIRTLLAAHPFVTELLPTLQWELDSGHVLGFGWSNLEDSVDAWLAVTGARRVVEPKEQGRHAGGSELWIRDAVGADTGALLAIYRPFVIETAVSFELEPPSTAEFEQRVLAAQSRWAWLVAERAGEVVGYAYGSPFRARAAYQWSVETSAYVHREQGGQGIGRALYARLLDVLEGKGYCTAYAGITLPNEASVRLHRSMGFAEVGVFRRAGRKFGAWHDVGWWQRELRAEPPGD